MTEASTAQRSAGEVHGMAWHGIKGGGTPACKVAGVVEFETATHTHTHTHGGSSSRCRSHRSPTACLQYTVAHGSDQDSPGSARSCTWSHPAVSRRLVVSGLAV